MAKITIAGDAVVITSSLKLDDLKKIEKYRPGALVLKGGEDGKEPIFVVGTGCKGSINAYGAEFNSATHDDEKLATITMALPFGANDVKAAVADLVGAAILNLNKLEATLPAVLAEIDAETAAILDNITVA